MYTRSRFGSLTPPGGYILVLAFLGHATLCHQPHQMIHNPRAAQYIRPPQKRSNAGA
jgi:hypothetical protein